MACTASRWLRRVFVCASVVVVAGCSKAAPPPRTLLDAQQAYDRAREGQTHELAPVELARAQRGIERANRAYESGESDGVVGDLAYAARRDVALAVRAGEQRAAQRDAAAPGSAQAGVNVWNADDWDDGITVEEERPPSTTVEQPVPTPAPAPVALATPRPRWPDLGASLTTNDRGTRDAALVVAIEDYAFLADVPGAQQNGEDWFKYLTSVRRIPLSRIRLLFNAEATDYAITESLRALAAQVEAGGRLWFVFIGHGAPSERGDDGLLVAVDAQQTARGIEQRSVRQRDVLATMSKAAGTPVAILDACYSGRGNDGGTLVAGLQPSRVVFAPVPRDAVVISAAASNEYAGPLPGERRPAFSYLALGGLRGWADDDRDGKVTASEIALYARSTLRVLLGPSRRQSPEARGRSDVVLSLGHEPGPDLGELLLTLRRSR